MFHPEIEVRGINVKYRGLALNEIAEWSLEPSLQNQMNLIRFTDQLCDHGQVA